MPDVEGFDQVRKALMSQPEAMMKVLRGANVRAARKIRDEFRKVTPVGDGELTNLEEKYENQGGHLKDKIKHKRRRGTPTTVVASVGVTKGSFYWAFLEFGTKHIRPRFMYTNAFDRITPRFWRMYQKMVGTAYKARLRRMRRRAAK